MKKEQVRHWMTTEVITLSPEATLPEAHRLMTSYNIRRLPVVQDNRIVGIVTLGDVREAEPSPATSLSVWEMNYLLSQLKVEKIMSKNPVTLSPHATISEAAWTMLEYKIGGLPVVDKEGQVLGVITESDIFRLVVQEWDRMEALAGA